jgi:tryptophan synthase alpha chain
LAELAYNLPATWRLYRACRVFHPQFIYERCNLYHLAGSLVSRLTGVPLLLEVNAPLAAERSKFGGLRFERLAAALERNTTLTSLQLMLNGIGVDGARDLAAAGGLGMITPDLIPDEADAWLSASQHHGLDRIFLVAPSSTPERLARTVEASRGFSYAASTMGVTGTRDVVSQAAPDLVARVREISDIPVGVGLGVRSAGQAAEIADFADGVIVGSALVSALSDGVGAVRSLTEELAVGVRKKVPTT